MGIAVGPLVGRTAQIAAGAAAARRALGGAPGVLCITGEPGSGKTALLDAIVHAAGTLTPAPTVIFLRPPAVTARPGAWMARMLADLLEGGDPSAVSIRERLGNLLPGDRPDVLDLQAAQIARASHLAPDSVQVADLAVLATRMALAAAARSPLLLAADDIHRMDSAACEWLCELLAAQASRGARLLIAATAPPSHSADPLAAGAGRGPAWCSFRPGRPEDARAAGQLEILILGPLADSDAREVLLAHADGAISADVAERVAQVAKGHVGTIVACARALAPGRSVPASLDDALRCELERLGADTRSLIEAAAVVEGPVSVADLGAIARVADPEPALARASVLRRVDGLVRFAEDGHAHRIARFLEPDAHAALHRQAGAVLEDRAALAAALHYERAADQPGLWRALGRAAREPSGAGADLAEARALMTRALEMSPAKDPPDDLLFALATANIALGHYEAASGLLARHAVALTGGARARAYRLMGRALERLGEYAAAMAHHQEGLALAEQLPPPERAGFLAEIATVLLRQGQYANACRHAEQALGLLPADSDDPDRALAHSVMGICLYRQGRYDLASHSHELALGIRERNGDARGVANSLNNLGTVHLDRGSWDEALVAFERALALAEAGTDARTMTALLNNLASLHLARNDVGAAEAACRAALAGKRDTGESPGLGIALATLGAIEAMLGHHSEAVAAFRDAVVTLESLGEREILADVYASYGEYLVERSLPEEAGAALRRALELAEESGKLAAISTAYRVFSELCRRQGRPAEALAFARQAVGLNRFAVRPLELARSLKQLAATGGDPDGLAASEAADLFRTLGIGPGIETSVT